MNSNLDVNKLLDSYTKWVREQYSVDSNSSYNEINTPFLNSINDNIRFYVTYTSDNKIVLDDNGDTLNNLEMMDVDISKGQRQLEFKSILNQFNVSNPDDRLLVKGTIKDFPIMKQNLITAIIRVDDLSSLKRKNIYNMFYDDIYDYFDENDFGGVPNHSVTGRSGNDNKFNYVIPRLKKAGRPERIIDFHNKLSFNEIAISIYKFDDVRNMYDDKKDSVIIYNDSETTPNERVVNAAKDSNILLFPFTDKENLNKLKAKGNL
ncbi:DUF1828 domain-containing protein [Apilactobacillus timberlakei]|uniref:DUF1828 domain-containing protein n=1 Tax=Apilactobacillus timberlakei TaxID=2008380 RepID=UPI00112B147E|nr:DUF1828 domain-containing protein [Apilactobacillus timberlakei]TPR16690.1 DUF1828 domain-containing protein [Apilactobacillus timberlakei]